VPTNVHFCWCGNYPDDANEWKVLETPTAVANDQHAQVYYWSTGACLNQIKAKLTGKTVGTIKWRDLASRSHVIGDNNEADFGWLTEYLDLVQFLIQEKLYIMVKDLVSLMVLLRSGGFFMDTTCKVADDTDVFKQRFELVPSNLTPHSLRHQIKSPPADIRIPIVFDRQKAKYNVINTTENLTSRAQLLKQDYGDLAVPEIEVWCLYAPQRAARGGKASKITLALDEAIERYLRRLRLFRQALAGQDDNLKGVLRSKMSVDGFKDDVQQILGDRKGDLFKGWVGANVTGAIYDALYALGYVSRTHVYDGTTIPDWAWGCYRVKVDPPQGNPPYALPKAGIIKRYGGSWY